MADTIGVEEHYLWKIDQYLISKGFQYADTLASGMKERKAGKVFSIVDHVKGMIYSLLSSQREWSGVASHLSQIDTIFFQYDGETILKTDPAYFVTEITKIKCGNRAIKRQMESLADNIRILKQIDSDYGSIDTFITSKPAYEIVAILSKSASKYKLPNMGEALVWEYLRNVGIDGAKPDLHLKRFLSGSRMGAGNHSPATNEEVYRTVLMLSQETGLSMAEIDILIWMFCAEGYGGVCGASPKCYQCPLKECAKRTE